MNFSECLSAASDHLKTRQCLLLEHRHPEGGSGSWWFSFSRVGALHRIIFEERSITLSLQKGQGSFVHGSPTKWMPLDARVLPDAAFETALEAILSLLQRFPVAVPRAIPAPRIGSPRGDMLSKPPRVHQDRWSP
jgi:hypothetical protein